MKEKKLYDTLKNDISEGGFKGNITTDFEELKEFFLNDERKKRLTGMGKVSRFFYMSWWLLSELLLKLTPARRLVLVFGIALLVLPGRLGMSSSEVDLSTNTSIFGGILILFVLMLELKDKLVAKDELGVGRTVQNALMSERNPIVPGWKIWLFTEPANDVGGDLVDIIELADDKYGVTIADVSGKGLGAALLMAKLQTIIRALSPDYISLSKMFEKVNSTFFKDIMPNSFASLVYIQLFKNNNEIEIVNAGHLPPIIIRDNSINHLEKGNVALGLMGESKFVSEKLLLNNGDYFVAFSDGVTEARNVMGEFFGLEKLSEFIDKATFNSPEELGQKLLLQVKYFIGEAKPHDDLSIVVLKKNL